MNTLSQKIRLAQTANNVPPEEYDLNFTSLADLLSRQALQTPDAEYLTFYEGNEKKLVLSFREFLHQVEIVRSYFREQGLSAGDRIATAAHNHPDTVIQYFAAWSSGLCVVPLNMGEYLERLHYIFSNSGSSMLLCREEYLSKAEAITKDCSAIIAVVGCPDEFVFAEKTQALSHLTIDNFSARISSLELTEECSSESVATLESEALIVYTSGTTGNPKGVVLVQRNLLADAHSISSWHAITPVDTFMCVLPIHHVNGTIVTLITPMYSGASVVLNRKFQTSTFFPTIAKENVTIVSVVPTLLAYLLEYHKENPDVHPSYDSLRHIICGAGPLTCELAQSFEERFQVRIVHGYGLSETTCYSCFLPLGLSDEEHTKWLQEYGFPSIGVPIATNEMAIHDIHGTELEEMQPGEIVIRGSNVMKGYFNNEEANTNAFTYNWFRSGDEGFYKTDSDGNKYFFITGRIKELIIRGGVNIAPLEIDEVINRAQGVRAGISVGFENSFYGEEVGGLVVPTSEDILAEDILAHCHKHLPFHKAPKVILFTDELPVTSTGKFQRNKVKHLFKDWKGEQFRK
jgi:long-chain acyl-CoA synthetase